MPEVRYLNIRFDKNIFPYEIHRFRAAVVEHTRREAPLFHNHTEEGKSVYQYPLIQYKVTFRKASIICLNEGADAIHHIFSQPSLELQVGQSCQHYQIENLEARKYEVRTWEQSFTYSLLNWLALNQKNHDYWLEANDDSGKQAKLLESTLTGNILAFAKGIHWSVREPVTTRIINLKQIKPLPFKGRDMLAFTLNFQTNVSLPNYIGLGKGASIGFGVVKRIWVDEGLNKRQLITDQ